MLVSSIPPQYQKELYFNNGVDETQTRLFPGQEPIMGRQVVSMDVLVVVALVMACVLCLLPGIMSWHYYYRGKRRNPGK